MKNDEKQRKSGFQKMSPPKKKIRKNFFLVKNVFLHVFQSFSRENKNPTRFLNFPQSPKKEKNEIPLNRSFWYT